MGQRTLAGRSIHVIDAGQNLDPEWGGEGVDLVPGYRVHAVWVRTSELAAQAAVNPLTLRWYERRGLLAEPVRTPGGYRAYPAAAVPRVRFIRRAQELGFTLIEGVRVTMSDLFGVCGQRLLDDLQLDGPFRARVDSLRRLIEAFTFEIDVLAKRSSAQLTGHAGFQAVQAIRGVGPVLAAIFVAEIGDVTRFARPEQLCSWAGMTPSTASPIPRFTGGGSPSRATRSCGGPRSRPSRPSTAARSGTPGSGSANAAA